MSNPWTEVYKDIREPFLQEKMAKKDYDGDGKIETGTQEYMGSRDKAIKKAMGKDPKKEMKKEELQRNLPQMKSGVKAFKPIKAGMKGGGLEKAPNMVRGMNKESMHSSNPAQQAAIAMAKKKREEDMMVDKKKKMKEEMKVQPPAQKLKTDRNMFQIPKSEQDAARERVLAKTKAKREKMKKEEVELGEMSCPSPTVKPTKDKNPKDMSKKVGQKAPVDYRTLAQSHVPVGNIFNEKMDPVGQEDKDIDNDGDHDSTDKYLLKRRKAIGKAIAKKRGRVKEGFSAWRIDLDFQEQVKK